MKKDENMFYLNYVNRPSYALLKTDPKKYQEEWKRYVTAQTNYQVFRANMESDLKAVAMMKASGMLNGLPCQGCTLGGGFGIFM